MNRPVRKKLSKQTMIEVIGIPKKMVDNTIDDFIVDSEDRQDLKDYIQDYMDCLDDNFDDCNGLYLYGSNGVGKTFISSLILKEAYRRRYSCKRVTFMEYCNKYTRIWDSRGEEKDSLTEELFTNYKGVEFLVLEEIGKGVENSTTIPILEDLLRYREDKGYVTIIATNITPDMLKEQYGISIYSLITGACTPIMIEDKDRRRKED